mgnify:CR=1 FL=1
MEYKKSLTAKSAEFDAKRICLATLAKYLSELCGKEGLTAKSAEFGAKNAKEDL